MNLPKKSAKKRSVIGSYENGEVEPNISTLLWISENFGVTIDDLINDLINKDLSINNTIPITESAEKSAEKSAERLPQSTNLSPKVLKTDINLDSEKALQVLEDESLVGRRVYISPEPATAGYLGSYVSEGKEPLEWFYMPFLKENGLYACFRVQGRSMEEYVLEGSWVVCRLLEQSWQIRSGNIHLVATKSEGVLLKRLRIEPKLKDKGIICYSDNPHYLPFFVPNEEVLAVWAVEMFIQREFPFLNEKAAKNLDNYLDSLEL